MRHASCQLWAWLIFDVSQKAMSSPMQRHSVVDVVAHDPKSGRALLAMTETRSWSEGVDALLFDLHEKLNTYVGYVAEGQLVRDYPRLEGKEVEFRLICSERPPEKVIATLRAWKEEVLDPRGITWSVTVLPDQ
jgi:hypothetical protein